MDAVKQAGQIDEFVLGHAPADTKSMNREQRRALDRVARKHQRLRK